MESLLALISNGMKTVFEHIEHVKGKPHHIRKRVAFAAATGGAMVIALVWLVGSLSLGVFAIQDNSFADAVGQGGIETTSGASKSSGPQNLAGAAAALLIKDTKPHIEIVDTTPSTPADKKVEQTTIPF